MIARRLRLPILAAALAGLAAACAYFTQGAPAPYRPPGVTAAAPVSGDLGATIYDRDCAWCHGSRGEGTPYGPDLDGALDGGAYTDFMLSTGRMPLSDPSKPARRGPPRYTDQEIAAIVAHVESFGGTGPGVPNPTVGSGDLAQGQALFQENCAACHSTTGDGGALTGGIAVPPLTIGALTPREVAEAMAVGPGCPNDSASCGVGEGAMPRFDLSSAEVDAITRFVASLRDQADPGGAPTGHVGPVAEGAVGILIGLGLAVLAIRWIGTRTERAR
jgi:ubiquinol-cytochrome c reductase cytochrome c subunit